VTQRAITLTAASDHEDGAHAEFRAQMCQACKAAGGRFR
jgi:hypothetical protein